METILSNLSSDDINSVKSAVYKKTIEKLLSLIEQKAASNPATAKTAASEEILALSDLLAEVIERALDLVDNTPIKLFNSTTGRSLFEVNGKYLLYPNIPYCNCRSFHNQVVTGEEYCCKHYIAARIAKAFNKVEIVEYSAFEFRKLLKRINF